MSEVEKLAQEQLNVFNQGDRRMKCDGCGKSAKTLFRKLLYHREYGCELMFYYCPKCYRKSKKK